MDNYKVINSVTKAVKRKDFEEVTDDFYLSSPALKIRRLNAELPPIVEGEDVDFAMRYEQVVPKNVKLSGVGDQFMMPDIEEVPPSVPENEQKAIVLFKPMNNPVSYTSTNISVDPSFMSSLKSQALLSMNLNTSERSKNDEYLTDGDEGEVNACRAVIPWAPNYHMNLKQEMPSSQAEVSDLDAMDAEEPEATTMEIEENVGAMDVGRQTSHYYRLSGITEGMPSQWQQPHCMFPQPPLSTATPVVWYR